MPDHLVRVVLLGLPVPQHVRSSEHLDDLRREFELIRRSGGTDTDSAPHRLGGLIEHLGTAFEGVSDQPDARLQEAIVRSRETINLEYRVPPEAAAALRDLGELLDEADEYCRAGQQLLTLATPPDALRYRRWFFGEFIRQVGGAAPTPWSEFVQGRSSGGGAPVARAVDQADPADRRSDHGREA